MEVNRKLVCITNEEVWVMEENPSVKAVRFVYNQVDVVGPPVGFMWFRVDKGVGAAIVGCTGRASHTFGSLVAGF